MKLGINIDHNKRKVPATLRDAVHEIEDLIQWVNQQYRQHHSLKRMQVVKLSNWVRTLVMVPIVVKENQTVRGVKMSEPLMNIVKIFVILFVCLFVYNTAFGKTITMEVDGKEIITITVAEEEPDCE